MRFIITSKSKMTKTNRVHNDTPVDKNDNTEADENVKLKQE